MMIEQIVQLWENLRFAEPAKLKLLAFLPAFFIFNTLIWLLWLYQRPARTYGSRYRFFGSFLFWFLSTATLGLLITALARPFFDKGNLIMKRGNVEVVFIVDSSSSMLLKDTGWARIDIATREIVRLPAMNILREGDRAALFILGITGVRLFPLSSDLDGFVDEVSKLGRPPSLLWTNIYWGSDIGSTLERVYNSLDRQDAFSKFKGKTPSGWMPEVRPNRFVVFLGDGDYFNYSKEDTWSEEKDKKSFESGLREFRRRGLKIYPIGIGTRTGGKMTDILSDYKEGEGYDSKLRDDLVGQESRLNVYNLEYMRSATGAERLFLVENVSISASNFLKTIIDSRRNISIEPQMSQEREELYPYFLIASLAIFLLGVLVTRF